MTYNVFGGTLNPAQSNPSRNYTAHLYCILCTPWRAVYCHAWRKQLVWLSLGYIYYALCYCSMIAVTTPGVACRGH